MLPRTARLHESADFARVTRSGSRAGRPTVVVHAARGTGAASRVGLVVSKAVGGAVVRNRVKRRLRHLAGEELRHLAGDGLRDRAGEELDARPTPAYDVVVRALPAAASAPERVSRDLGSAWSQALTRLSPGPTRDPS